MVVWAQPRARLYIYSHIFPSPFSQNIYTTPFGRPLWIVVQAPTKDNPYDYNYQNHLMHMLYLAYLSCKMAFSVCVVYFNVWQTPYHPMYCYSVGGPVFPGRPIRVSYPRPHQTHKRFLVSAGFPLYPHLLLSEGATAGLFHNSSPGSSIRSPHPRTLQGYHLRILHDLVMMLTVTLK